jgi:large subunit ribosomal protein L15
MSMIHEITALAPRNKRSQRKGRGESSGRGKTSGKGTKGSKARVGKYIKRGYEGGQTPLFRRWPKRGFSNANFERRYFVVNLADLERFPEGSTVDGAALIEEGLVPDETLPIKVLANGEFSRKLTVVAAWYSKTAHQKVVAAGGSALNLKNEPFEFPKPKKKFVPKDPVKKKEKGTEAPEAPPAGGQAPPAAQAPAAGAPAEPEKPTE